MNLALSQNMFEELKKAFEEKYNGHESLTYIKTEYFHKNQNWFEGFGQNCPSTNNAIESFNAVLKRCYTLRERMAVGDFLESMENMLNEQSLLRDPISKDSKPFQTLKIIKKKTWQAAYELDKSDFFENTVFIKKIIIILTTR